MTVQFEIEDSSEQAQFRDEFRAWLREVLPTGWMEAVDAGDDDAFARAKDGWNFMSWTPTIGRSGYGAPLWPKELGGLSGEVWMLQITREELRRYRLPLIGLNLLGVGLAGPTIIEHGTDAQRSRWLAKILSCEEIWCQLFSEPGAGSDLAGLGTRAVRDGDEWVVNGQKVWTTIAQFARWGMLVARTDPNVPKHDGLTYFALDMRAPGVEVRPLRQMTGSAEFNEVYMTDVRVPDENRIGAVGDGWRVARTTLMNERATLSGLSLDPVSMFGGQRSDPWQSYLDSLGRDGDSGLGSDPVLRQQITQFFIEAQAKEATAFRANIARQAGQPGPEGSVGKVFNAEWNQRRFSTAINAAGANGIAWHAGDTAAESRVQSFLRARANTIEGGTSEILRSQIAERVLGLPRDVEVDRDVPWSEIPR
ncbi:MAG: acyl-CoA dehydrogenase family protein [Acidimicrobiia bacterium]|nr:acyl-CoA dehydrogenase family protein [Acidimicrobiia bacterium]